MTPCVYTVRKRKKKKRIVLAVLLLFCLGVYLFMVYSVRPVVRTLSQEAIRSLTVTQVNQAVAEVMDANPAFVQLTEVVKDEAGNISVIRADPVAVNALARGVTENAQNRLVQLGEEGVGIPIGSLSGISVLAGRGPNVYIKAIPIGNIDTAFSSEFVSAGINQTLHKFFIEVTATVNIILPGAENKVTTSAQVLVGESIIIGKVPEMIFGVHAADSSYNLVP